MTSDECREKGNQYMKEEKYVEAMFHYTLGVKRDPHNAYLYSNRSLAFLRMEQYYLALEDAKTAIQLMPKWAKGYYRKGEIECAAEHYKEAIESFKQGIQVKPDDRGLKEAVVKATSMYERQLRSESRLVWYGVALGALVGVVLVVIDEAVTTQPLLQNDILRLLLLVVLSAVCYGLAVLYRLFLRSQRSSLLENPPDLIGGNDALDGLLPATNTSSSTRQQQQRDEPLKPTSSQHSKKHS